MSRELPSDTRARMSPLATLHARLAELGFGDTGEHSSELDLALDLLETAHVIVLVLDGAGRIVFVNPYFEQLSGYSLTELEHKDWISRCIPKLLQPEVTRVFRCAISGEATQGNVNTVQMRDGSVRVVEWYDRALHGADQEIIGILAIGHDITDKARAVAELEAAKEALEHKIAARTSELASSEKKYRELVETLDECLYRMRIPDGAYEYMSPSCEVVFGYPTERFLQHPLFVADIVVPEHREAYEAFWVAVRRGEIPATIEYQVTDREAAQRWIIQSNKGVHAADGALVAIEGICRDISEAKRTQLAFATNYQILEGSFDVSTVHLAYLDRDMNFLRVNRAYAAADGKPPEYFVGKNHFDLYPHPENEIIFARVRDTGATYTTLARPFEYAHNPERGVSHWDWTLTPVKDATGKVTSLVLALRDVTDRVIAIERLQESEARIARQLQEKELLLHEVHHRVKNNLQTIASLINLQSMASDGPEVVQALQETRHRILAMSMVHDLLYSADDLSCIDFEKYLTRLTQSLAAAYRAPESSISIMVEVVVAPLDLAVAMPCGLIAAELIGNALKHAYVGRTQGRLSVSLTEAVGGPLCLEVRDDGVGFLPSRLEEARSLGLKLVRSLARQLGGELGARQDGGAVFFVQFARARR